MIKCQKIMDLMETFAPRKLAEDWDNPGLTVGYPQKDVERIFLTLTVTDDAVERAMQSRADMIISHHPLIFKPIKSLRTDRPMGRIVERIIKGDLALFSAHTNLDSAAGGVNDVLAELLGVEKTKPLAKSLYDESLGLGRIGYLPEEMSLEDFCRQVKEKLDVSDLRLVVAKDKHPVQKVALCGGSAAEYIERAAFLGADLYLTGDVRYHDAQKAMELGIHLVDAGHFATERQVLPHLAHRLKEALQGNCEVIVDEVAKDFFQYDNA